MSEADRLQAGVLAARLRATASAEALGYRTDVQARTKEVVGAAAETVKMTVLQGFESVKHGAGEAAAGAQRSARTTAQSAVETAQAVVETAKATVATVADGLLDRAAMHDEPAP